MSKSALAMLVVCCGCTGVMLEDEAPRADWTDFVEERSPEDSPIDELVLDGEALAFEPIELVVRPRSQPVTELCGTDGATDLHVRSGSRLVAMQALQVLAERDLEEYGRFGISPWSASWIAVSERIAYAGEPRPTQEYTVGARDVLAYDVGDAQVLCLQIIRDGEALLLERIDIGSDWSWPCGRSCPVR